MKNILLFLLFISLSFFVKAQVCNPTWPAGQRPGILPDSATNLPLAYEGQPYNAVVNMKVPKDTFYIFARIPIDSVNIISINGLDSIPATVPFSYQCNPGLCRVKGDSVGCITITGTPAAGSAGTYYLKVYLEIHAGIINRSDSSLDYYKITVMHPSGISELNTLKFSSTAFPNPFNDETEIAFNTPKSMGVTVRLMNVLGQEIYKDNIRSIVGINKYILHEKDLNDGIYFYSLETAEGKIVQKILKQ